MNQMRVSVAMCTYNGEKYLREQIDSILQQTITVNEIIVCDDMSSDDTTLILEEYKKKHPNLFYIHTNEVNLKSIKNFEKAISLCTGDILFLSDQDDVWMNNKVEEILKTFELNPTIQVIATNGECIDENGKKINSKTIWDLISKVNRSYFKIISSYQNFATGATIALKSKFALNNSIFPLTIHHDEWLALKASYDNIFLFIDQKLIKYRIHPQQQVGSILLSDRLFKNTLSKMNTSLEDLKFYELFSNLKKIKRKVRNLESFKEIDYEFGIKMEKYLNSEILKISTFAKKKFTILYFIHKALNKI